VSGKETVDPIATQEHINVVSPSADVSSKDHRFGTDDGNARQEQDGARAHRNIELINHAISTRHHGRRGNTRDGDSGSQAAAVDKIEIAVADGCKSKRDEGNARQAGVSWADQAQAAFLGLGSLLLQIDSTID
jgi:hypothetical protein